MNATPLMEETRPTMMDKIPSPQAPPHCTGDLAKCRVGDWEQPSFVIEWFGRPGVQSYQPGQPDPFAVESFDPARPVWLFERVPHPSSARVRGLPCSVWKRIA